ncbi:MAG TPA: calcium-binding protein, partial [Roseateles sp.]|uniref:calcium-binding protein n=1 Tax=Roseateles sp. TaxID=1971397 RepID=UPI002ED86820
GVVVSEQGIASLVANQGSALGTAGADFLIGSDGASDSLAGLGGNDTIYGGGGNDVIDGGEGSDYLSGDDGNDEIHGGLGDDSILGAAGDDLLFGEGGVDTLSGGDGDDVLTGGVSAYGGAGNDIIYGTAGSDSLYGEGGNDSLNGGSGNDTLWGGVGNDTLQGGAGNDYLYGEAGDDVYLFGRGDGADTILGNFNGGYDELQLAAGIAPGEVSASRAGGADLLLSINGTSDSVLVKDFLNQASSLALIRFADGTTWTSDALIEQLSSIVGTSGADSLTGGSGHDKLRGLEGNDTLLGGAGRDTLDGGAGADRMLGGADNDKYIVDSTSDVVIEYAGEGDYDYIESSVTYTLPSNVEDLILVGTSNINATGNSLDNELDGNSGNNSLSGGAGHDLLFGNEGNDTLNGGTGDDSMWGGLGDDSYVVDAAPVWAADEQVAGDFIEEEEGEGIDSVSSSVAYALPANVENLTLTGSSGIAGTGNELANMLIGNSGANRISAGDGDDTLNGGSGADTLVGGRGDDSYVVDATGDVITEYANEGTDSVQASVSWTLGVNLENLTLTGASGLSGAGNALDNIIIGNGGANSLSGGAGNDTLDGGAGKDTLVGGAGNDTYVVDVSTDVVTENSNEGIDTVRSAVTWTLGTNLENLVLTGTSAINGTGNASNNMLTGNGANNTLTGGAGNDTLDGGAGTDSLVGGTGDDTYIVDATTDVVAENAGEGTDIVLSNVTWTLGSNVEHLTLTGSSSVNGTGNTLANMLTGNSGANTLAGAAGNDTLDGGAGNDTLNGGAGADTYMLGIGYGNDVIVDSDSTAGVTDVVRFGVGLTQSDIRFTQSGNALVATIKNSSESLTIQDWYLSAHNRVEEFRFDDGTVLTSVQAQALVGAMAAFNPTGPGIAMVNETSGQHMSRAAGIAVSGAA